MTALVKATGNNASAYTNAEAAAKTDLVFLALPWKAAEGIVKGLGDVSGKVIMNPINGLKVTNGRFEAPPDLKTSSGEMI